MKNLRNLRKFQKLFGSMVIVFAICFLFGGSINVKAEQTNDDETVEITIDNTNTHYVVRFYPDTNDLDYFEVVDQMETQMFTVSKDSVVRIRLYVQADGYRVPDNYDIEGAVTLTDDDRVNYGWCRAAYTINADATKTITLPQDEVCTHPYADPSVRWGYYNCGDGTHAQSCTLCSVNIPETVANHTLSEMTPTEYVDWYYSDGNFAGVSEETLATYKASFLTKITDDLGISADTKAKFCTICEYWEKLENAPSETPSETPSVTPSETTSAYVSVSLNDNSGVLPAGTTLTVESITSGDVYERVTAIIQQKINGLGQFVVMEMNLIDTANTQLHELNGYVQVSIPIPSNLSINSEKTIVVYRLEEDGSLTRCQTTVENGVITFLTNHFSWYVIVEENAVTSPKTGDDSNIYIVYMMMAVSGFGIVVFARRKRCSHKHIG